MKKILFSLFTFVLAIGMVNAQTAEELYKEANKIWKKSINADAAEKATMAAETAAKLDMAMEGAASLEEKKAAKIYKLRGETYNELASQNINMFTINNAYEVKNFDAGIKSFESYKKLYEIATKKYNKKDGMNGMKGGLKAMDSMGRVAFQKKDYKNAYLNFNGAATGFDFLKEQGGDSELFPSDAEYNQNLLYAGLTAVAAGMTAEAQPIFEKLYEAKYDDPGVYENLYKVYAESDPEKALTILSTGREKYPENEGLLVAEINYYMQNDKLDELTDKLKKAIELDPTNTSFYLALGSTYDNLTQRELKAGNQEKSDGYFAEALKYYNQTLDVDAKNPTAVYSIGALYYNRAASMLTQLIALEEEGDYSKAGLAKQTKMREDIIAEFKKALPFFQDSERLNPNDMNTLLALKEIYARMDDFETSNVFKGRIEQLNAGETLEKSYFADK